MGTVKSFYSALPISAYLYFYIHTLYFDSGKCTNAHKAKSEKWATGAIKQNQ